MKFIKAVGVSEGWFLTVDKMVWHLGTADQHDLRWVLAQTFTRRINKMDGVEFPAVWFTRRHNGCYVDGVYHLRIAGDEVRLTGEEAAYLLAAITRIPTDWATYERQIKASHELAELAKV